MPGSDASAHILAHAPARVDKAWATNVKVNSSRLDLLICAAGPVSAPSLAAVTPAASNARDHSRLLLYSGRAWGQVSLCNSRVPVSAS